EDARAGNLDPRADQVGFHLAGFRHLGHRAERAGILGIEHVIPGRLLEADPYGVTTAAGITKPAELTDESPRRWRRWRGSDCRPRSGWARRWRRIGTPPRHRRPDAEPE